MKKILIGVLLLSNMAFLISCNDDDTNDLIVPDAGTIAGGPFTFVVDGVADNVSGVTVDGTAVGTNSGWIITDDQNNILGLPPTIADLEGVNFDGAGVGVCFIWYIRYEDGLTGLATSNNVADLDGTFDISNSITVNRVALGGATLSGGPYTFIVDGMADNVSGITVDDSGVNGMNTTFVITDDQNNILGLPPTLSDVEGVDFDGAGSGICFIWHLTYAEGLTGLMAGNNTSQLMGDFVLSNSIMVTRASAGTIGGGPFTFVVDGTVDNVSGITLSDYTDLANTGWVITDDQNNILGLPPTLADVEGVDFDGAGAGVCFIWRITYSDGLTGLMAGQNVSGLSGTYSLSNSITVNRASAGMISGGPFTFVVDGTIDNVSGISFSGNSDLDNSGWVITDDQNNILGLPPTLADVEGVDFDGAGSGICFIWRITYSDGLTGLMGGENVSGLSGTYSLSNSITVTRASAGMISGGPFTFTVDGNADNVSGITLSDNTDLDNTGWIITDDQNNILGLPPTLAAVEGVDFDGAGTGVCLIWRITYSDGLTGLMANENVSGLNGVYSISNSITVTRN